MSSQWFLSFMINTINLCLKKSQNINNLISIILCQSYLFRGVIMRKIVTIIIVLMITAFVNPVSLAAVSQEKESTI